MICPVQESTTDVKKNDTDKKPTLWERISQKVSDVYQTAKLTLSCPEVQVVLGLFITSIAMHKFVKYLNHREDPQQEKMAILLTKLAYPFNSEASKKGPHLNERLNSTTQEFLNKRNLSSINDLNSSQKAILKLQLGRLVNGWAREKQDHCARLEMPELQKRILVSLKAYPLKYEKSWEEVTQDMRRIYRLNNHEQDRVRISMLEYASECIDSIVGKID